MQLVQGGHGGRVIRGGRDKQIDVAAEGDQTQIHARGQLLGEGLRRILRGPQTSWRNIFGLHGLRHVDDQHHDRTIAGNPRLMGRPPRQRNYEQQQRTDCQRNRQVPQAMWSLGRKPLHGRRVTELPQALSAPKLCGHVQSGEQCGGDHRK